MDVSVNAHAIEPENAAEVLHEGDVKDGEASNKLWRRKKTHKSLYLNVLNQIEFYFSASNLAKDRFMSKMIQEDPCKIQCKKHVLIL